jgi:hypothetical protein
MQSRAGPRKTNLRRPRFSPCLRDLRVHTGPRRIATMKSPAPLPRYVRPLLRAALGLGAVALVLCAAEPPAAPPAPRASYDVAAFIWPSYHPDDRAKIFWPMGIGEWETVLSNKPKYEGHEQPRRPLWGYVNEADPYVMQMQIDAAADHGVNVFIYDWYWYDDLPFLEGCLNDGYLKARNNHRVKFYLMWANHDVNLMWDKRNADDSAKRKNKAVIWRGGVNFEEFQKIARRTIERYFSQPTYYKVGGKPAYMIYDLATFVRDIGGAGRAKEALAWFRAETVKAGFPGLELQVSMRRERRGAITGVGSDGTGTQRGMIDQLGIDALTHYQFVHFVDMNREYPAALKDVLAEWSAISRDYRQPYYPHVSVGWDSSPRTMTHVGAVVKSNTPENFEKALRAAKDYVDAHPGQAPLITINSWNEWTETSYLQPCDRHGYGYLQAVKRVFGR